MRCICCNAMFNPQIEYKTLPDGSRVFSHFAELCGVCLEAAYREYSYSEEYEDRCIKADEGLTAMKSSTY